MSERQEVQWVFNSQTDSHGKYLATALKGATRLDCMVAFAKMTGLRPLMKQLKSCLKRGLVVRFAVSRDFYITDPELLRQLFKLSQRYSLRLYLSRLDRSFHPKVYSFSYTGRSLVLVGSANLTSGGLESNFEASALIHDTAGALSKNVSSCIDKLVEKKELVEAKANHIEEYVRLHLLYHAFRGIADARFNETKDLDEGETKSLEYFLREMKSDQSEKGFRAQIHIRSKCRVDALKKIKQLAALKKRGRRAFLIQYEQLLGLLHSGGLHRGKKRIAEKADRFSQALAAVLRLKEPTAEQAYQVLLEHFKEIPRAGVNILTEILLALDSKKFAVMNQNAVSGLRMANISAFPAKPNKQNVSAKQYAEYCQLAARVRGNLGLRDFAELDALFNYAYWEQQLVEEE
jgi:HKD family nuclease